MLERNVCMKLTLKILRKVSLTSPVSLSLSLLLLQKRIKASLWYIFRINFIVSSLKRGNKSKSLINFDFNEKNQRVGKTFFFFFSRRISRQKTFYLEIHSLESTFPGKSCTSSRCLLFQSLLKWLTLRRSRSFTECHVAAFCPSFLSCPGTSLIHRMGVCRMPLSTKKYTIQKCWGVNDYRSALDHWGR